MGVIKIEDDPEKVAVEVGTGKREVGVWNESMEEAVDVLKDIEVGLDPVTENEETR